MNSQQSHQDTDLCTMYHPTTQELLSPTVVVSSHMAPTAGALIAATTPIGATVLVDDYGNAVMPAAFVTAVTPNGVVGGLNVAAIAEASPSVVPTPLGAHQPLVDPYTVAAATFGSFAVAPGAEHTAQKLQQLHLQQHQMQHQQFYVNSQQDATSQQLPGPSNNITAVDSKKIVMDYESDFPTLAPTEQTGLPNDHSIAWTNRSNKTLPVKSNNATQVFHFPAEERHYLHSREASFGDKNKEQEECNNIMQKTSTQIDLCQNKDMSLTIVVSGKRSNVEEARKLIVQSLQTQCNCEIYVSKEHHRVLIGHEGKRLQQLEKETNCRIMIPNRDTPDETIKIIGPREGIDRAIHQIQLISDEQSKLAQEHISVPKVLYPWIRGPHNEIVDRISKETGVRINIPPTAAASDIIVVTGEKEGVKRAVTIIKQIVEDKKGIQTVSAKIEKSQHRFVIGQQGSGIAEIMRDTGVSVEVPPEDSESNVMTLRGDPLKIAEALAAVYAKAASVITDSVNCFSWLHKYVIGPKGAGIRQILGDDGSGGRSPVQVTFEDDGRIFIEGPPIEVKRVKEDLSRTVKDLQAEYMYEILHINPMYHRHLIGKSGIIISRIRQETGASITIPLDEMHSDEVRVEGKRNGVAKAVSEIMEIVKKMENEKSRDIIIDNRFHRLIIGTKGESVRELKEKFPGVNINFPKAGRKTDIVTLRGPRDEVDKCYKYLQNMAEEMSENNYQEKLLVYKEFHPRIIGKGGANIRKIREETDTKIDLPTEDSSTDVIIITGKKANVEKARDMIKKLEAELANIVTVEIIIPHKVQLSMLNGGGRLINHIAQNECGGVHIKFPSEKSQSDKVTITGPKEGVEKAKKMLQDLAKDREATSYTAEVKAKPELFRYLIGRGGIKIQKLCESNPSVRIMLPRQEDKDQETIHLVGNRKDVENAKKQLESTIHELNQMVEIQVDIDPKWHKNFTIRGAYLIREIQDQCGGVAIRFHKSNADSPPSPQVTIKGGKDCAESAKKRLLEMVHDFESQVTIQVHIPRQHYGLLLSNRGSKIHDITNHCGVQIKFPDRARATTNNNGTNGHNIRSQLDSSQTSPLPTSDYSGSLDDTTSNSEENNVVDAQDLVTIIGLPEKCQQAKELLMAEIPIVEKIDVPFEYHRNLIGRNGIEIRKFMDRFGVNIRIPPAEQQSDEITVTGPPAAVHQALDALMEKNKEFREDAKQRELKSYQIVAHVPAEYHPKLIGNHGSEINRIRVKHDVQIIIPQKNSENSDQITIIGFEKNANDCKNEIESLVNEYKLLCVQEISLDCRIHSRIIGQKGKNIRKVMDDYKVDVRFPRSSDPNPNLVVISGKNEDSVYDCIDHLRNLEEEFLQGITDRYRDLIHVQMDEKKQNGCMDVEISGKTPWEQQPGGKQIMPDVADMNDFPSMPNEGARGVSPSVPPLISSYSNNNCNQSPNARWGPSSKTY